MLRIRVIGDRRGVLVTLGKADRQLGAVPVPVELATPFTWYAVRQASR